MNTLEEEYGAYRIGIDFDNTMINYDTIFNKAGVEKKLIPGDLPKGKNSVRNYLRKMNREHDWTELQGYVYGEGILDAPPFEGVANFFAFCRNLSVSLNIVSHKTVYPYKGYPYNLHDAARQWLEQEKLDCDVYFEPTKEEKISRIAMLGCTHFIDDLPEFLALPGFPGNLVKILFDPLNQFSKTDSSFMVVRSWREIFCLLRDGRL